MPFRLTLFILALALMPFGIARAQSLIPIEVQAASPADKVLLERYVEKAEQLSFAVDAPNSVRLRVTPKVFSIVAGREYSINTSYFEPFTITAAKDGELILNLDTPRNCSVLIEPSPGGNLLQNGSFETIMEANASGWTSHVDRTLKSNLEHGHETLSEKGAPLGAETVVQSEANVTNKRARTGRYSFRLSKSTVAGNIEVRTAAPVNVEAGKEYLLSGWYQLENLKFGSSMHFIATVTGQDKPPIYVRDINLNPLISTEQGGWQRAFFRFKVPADYTQAQVLILISERGAPFSCYWDDLDLRVAPTPVAQLPKALTKTQLDSPRSEAEVRRIMKTRKPLQVKVTRQNGQPRVWVDGKPLPLFGFTSGPYNWPGGGAHADFFKAGVKVHWIPLYTGETGQYKEYGEPIWLGKGKYDFSRVEKQLLYILGHDPNALVLFYCYVRPYPTFADNHPEAAWIDDKGKKSVGDKSDFSSGDTHLPHAGFNHSYTASEFRTQAADMLEQLGKYLTTIDAGKAVLGLHLVCGSDGQWFSQHWPDHYDRSAGNQAAFRDWLRRRYRTQSTLRAAWKQNDVTFETASLPQEIERSPAKYFLDKKDGRDRRVIDANRFSNEGVAETINLFAHAWKRGIKRRALVTTYYSDIIHDHGLNHWALHTLLKSDALDGIISVMDYGLWRALGRTGSYNSLIASLRLHNKIFLTEMDYRTDYSWLPVDAHTYRKEWGVPRGEEAWYHQIRRDLGMSLAQGQGGWIYGLGGNGWVNEKYMAGISEANRAAQNSTKNPLPTDRGQIGVFCDERIQDYTSRHEGFGSMISMTGYNISRQTLSRSGLTWDAYLLDDLEHAERPKYKINVFLGAPTITPQQIAWVQKNLQKDGNVLVFINCAGYSLGAGFEKNIRALTGMDVRVDLTQSGVYRYAATGKDSLSRGLEYLITETKTPLFYVADKTAIPLAKLEGTEKIGAAVKRFKNWTSVYLALPGGFTPNFLRALAREAKITPIGPPDDATYAGNGFLVLHALHSGLKTLRWKGASDVVDLATGKIVARNVEQISFDMKALETRWLRRTPRVVSNRATPSATQSTLDAKRGQSTLPAINRADTTAVQRAAPKRAGRD